MMAVRNGAPPPGSGATRDHSPESMPRAAVHTDNLDLVVGPEFLADPGLYPARTSWRSGDCQAARPSYPAYSWLLSGARMPSVVGGETPRRWNHCLSASAIVNALRLLTCCRFPATWVGGSGSGTQVISRAACADTGSRTSSVGSSLRSGGHAPAETPGAQWATHVPGGRKLLREAVRSGARSSSCCPGWDASFPRRASILTCRCVSPRIWLAARSIER